MIYMKKIRIKTKEIAKAISYFRIIFAIRQPESSES